MANLTPLFPFPPSDTTHYVNMYIDEFTLIDELTVLKLG